MEPLDFIKDRKDIWEDEWRYSCDSAWKLLDLWGRQRAGQGILLPLSPREQDLRRYTETSISISRWENWDTEKGLPKH